MGRGETDNYGARDGRCRLENPITRLAAGHDRRRAAARASPTKLRKFDT